MELLCASVCHPTMLSFQVNCYGWDHQKGTRYTCSEHRVGARGNMTAFQVPWENVFSEMEKVRDCSQDTAPTDWHGSVAAGSSAVAKERSGSG